jgi:hypothetical protein
MLSAEDKQWEASLPADVKILSKHADGRYDIDMNGTKMSGQKNALEFILSKRKAPSATPRETVTPSRGRIFVEKARAFFGSGVGQVVAVAILVAMAAGVFAGAAGVARNMGITMFTEQCFNLACNAWVQTPSAVHKGDTSTIVKRLSRLPVAQRNDLAWNCVYSMLFVQNIAKNREGASQIQGGLATSMQTNLLIGIVKAALRKRVGSGASAAIDTLQKTQPRDLLALASTIGEKAILSDVTDWPAEIQTIRSGPIASRLSEDDIARLMCLIRSRYNSCVLHIMVADTLDESEIDDVLPTLTEFRKTQDLAGTLSPEQLRSGLREFYDAAASSATVDPTFGMNVNDAVFSKISDQIVSLLQ